LCLVKTPSATEIVAFPATAGYLVAPLLEHVTGVQRPEIKGVIWRATGQPPGHHRTFLPGSHNHDIARLAFLARVHYQAGITELQRVCPVWAWQSVV